jgi:gamma-glutamyltranspeptidase/glutathione hydrolase
MGFGSGIVIPETGIAMQNRGAGFVLEPGHPNAVSGGRRPYHTIIPGFITRNDAPEAAFGVMGGHMQPQGHLQVLSHLVDGGRNPQAALDAPRWRIDQGRRVHLEPGFSAATLDGLRDRGHEILNAQERSVAFGGGQVVQRVETDYVAGSDARRDGLAMGR